MKIKKETSNGTQYCEKIPFSNIGLGTGNKNFAHQKTKFKRS